MAEYQLDPAHWPELPGAHRSVLDQALPRLRAEARLLGVLAGGSFARGGLDEHSDLDLVLVGAPEHWRDALRDAQPLASELGPLLAGFTGEHVGEPRLLICLYGPPLLHVDLQFVSCDDLATRDEEPVVLWDRDGRTRAGLARGRARPVRPDLQWIEDRFWVWVHYLAAKIARGELFEAIGSFSFLRDRVLGPLALAAASQPPYGVRRLEVHAPEQVAPLAVTIGAHDPAAARRALDAAVALYLELRERVAPPELVRHRAAERAAREFVQATLGDREG